MAPCLHCGYLVSPLDSMGSSSAMCTYMCSYTQSKNGIHPDPSGHRILQRELEAIIPAWPLQPPSSIRVVISRGSSTQPHYVQVPCCEEDNRVLLLANPSEGPEGHPKHRVPAAITAFALQLLVAWVRKGAPERIDPWTHTHQKRERPHLYPLQIDMGRQYKNTSREASWCV